MALTGLWTASYEWAQRYRANRRTERRLNGRKPSCDQAHGFGYTSRDSMACAMANCLTSIHI